MTTSRSLVADADAAAKPLEPNEHDAAPPHDRVFVAGVAIAIALLAIVVLSIGRDSRLGPWESWTRCSCAIGASALLLLLLQQYTALARRMQRSERRYHDFINSLTPDAGSDHLDEWIATAADVDDHQLADTIIAESTARLARSAQNDRAVAIGLREANRLLVMAEQMAHVGHYRLDLLTEDVVWSDEIYRTYGMPPEFTPNLDWLLRAYHPDDRDRMIDILRTTLEDGTSFTVTARIVRPDGTIRTVATGGQVERAPDGTIVGLFGILQDMTSIKAIEIERERLNERVILATKAGKIGIWEWTIASDRLEWDSAMYALYGRASGRGEPSYDMWLSAIDPRDRERAAIEVERALSGTAPLDMEFRVIWPSGESRQLRAIGTLLIDPQGGSPRMVGANWDISETRALADDLREEKERAEQANRAKTEFLARMSHEIRTPMNGIIGFTTLVLDGELSAEQRRYVSLLRDAGRSLLAIINDILDFSKLEAGRIELESIPVNLSALIDGALSIVRSEAIPKGIVLDIDIDSAVPQWVSGDPTRLRQTLLNLLTNALKFTDHGSIAVRVERERGPLPDRLRVEIADTGIGIASESQHLLFSDFSQLEKSTPRRYGGTGLGLAICKRLVEAMNGSIGVRSEAGAGSVFWFTARLPEVGAPTAGALHDQTPRVQARRILVADDNRVNQIVVSGLLTRDGHDVTLVENGREAVDAVRDGVYDLVLMDMQMPLMDGIEATLAIRQLAAPRGDIAIVALTANAMEEEVERCHAAGMNGHLAKPIDRELLRRAITRWTGNHDRSQALPPALEPAGSPADADPPSIGVAALLDIFDGDVPSVCDILRAARTSIEIDLERITSAVRTQDAAMVQEAAHRMKGTSGSIRCARILTISAALGEAAKSGLSAIEPALVRDLESAIAALRNDVDAYLRHASTPTVTPSSAPSIGQSPG